MNIIISKHAALVAALFGLSMAAASAPALAQRQSAQEQRKDQTAQIPTCAKRLGTISVIEPEDATNWWSGQQ
ncbi:MAG: CsgG/HfaB family protein, partial [Pseudoxanthomonas sp.]